MSITGMFDHTARVMRPTETEDQYGDVIHTYAEAAVIPLALVPPKLTLRDAGPGDQPAGRMEAYAAADAGLTRQDVLDVTAGPEAGTRWRVLSVAHPRGNHAEAVCEPFSGDLT